MDTCGEEMKKMAKVKEWSEGILLGKYVLGYKPFVTGLSVQLMITRDE